MSATTEAPVNHSAHNGHDRCLICGSLNPRSLHLSFQTSGDGGVRTRFTPADELQGYDGILHGGVVASLLDAAMTHCLFHRGIRAVTGDLHVRYVQSVSCNAPFDICACVLSSHPPLHRLRAEIVLDEHLLAWAEAKFMERRALQ